MATPTGSALANLAAKRRQVKKAGQVLGLDQRGVPKPQRPGPPPKPPADQRPPQQAPTQPEGQLEIPPEAREQLRQRIAGFLQQMRAGGAQPVEGERVQRVDTQPTGLISQQAARLGLEGLSLREQFRRLAGRPPSPRELNMFAARMELERQLGRPPTVNELKEYISQPDRLSPSFPVAFEGAQ